MESLVGNDNYLKFNSEINWEPVDNGCAYFHDLHSNVIVTLLGFFSGETFYIQM